MNILITGATGFIGRSLTARLISEGHEITAWVRNKPRAESLLGTDINIIEQLEQLTNQHFDAVINLAGEPIADKRWTDSRKQALRNSRISLTRELIACINRLPEQPSVFLSGSAIGYYGSHDADIEITESFLPAATDVSDDFAHQLCKDWETAALAIENRHTRVCLLRTGIVLGHNGGALGKMLLPFRLGLGGPMGNGEQVMSWIHLHDWIEAAMFLLNNPEASGAFNLVSPQAVSNSVFSRALAAAVHRPAFFSVPCVIMKVLMGESSSLLCAGQNVLPDKLQSTGFNFTYNNINDAFREIVSHL